MTAPAAPPLLDEARFAELTEVLGAGAVETLVTLFERELRSRPAAVRRCALAGDRTGLREAAHLCRGAALGIGATGVAASALTLEQIDSDDVNASLDAFELVVARTLAVLPGARI